MARTRTYRPGLSVLALVMSAACARSSPTAPSSVLPSATTALDVAAERPFRGECQTQVAPISPPPQGTCRVFEPAPSAFIEVTGTCQITHLGRSTTHAVQQLLFALDSQGQPIFVGGQPVITALRNCAEFTSANGDVLTHITTGTVVPGPQPGTVAFTGSLTFDGGTGRFAGASGSAAFDGTASLITNTGHLAMEGRLGY
jgi:hypothetical protein